MFPFDNRLDYIRNLNVIPNTLIGPRNVRQRIKNSVGANELF